MRFRIMSSPACSRQMQMRHQPRFLGHGSASRSASISAESMEDSRSRGSSGTSFRMRRTSWPRRRRARQIGALGGDVDARSAPSR